MLRYEIFTKIVGKIGRNIRKIKSAETCKFNLTGPCVNCIYYLFKHEEGLTAHELSELCDEDKAAISRTLSYLESNGYITCTSTAKKRYNSTLLLTEKGKEVGRAAVEVIDSVLEEVSVGVSEEEREAFYKTFTKISDNLEKISNRSGGNYD